MNATASRPGSEGGRSGPSVAPGPGPGPDVGEAPVLGRPSARAGDEGDLGHHARALDGRAQAPEEVEAVEVLGQGDEPRPRAPQHVGGLLEAVAGVDADNVRLARRDRELPDQRVAPVRHPHRDGVAGPDPVLAQLGGQGTDPAPELAAGGGTSGRRRRALVDQHGVGVAAGEATEEIGEVGGTSPAGGKAATRRGVVRPGNRGRRHGSRSLPGGTPAVRGDYRLTTGRGRYVADLRVPGCLEAAFVRSPVRTPTCGASTPRLPHDAGRQAGPHRRRPDRRRGDPTMFGAQDAPPWRPLAIDRVRYEGEPVALVVADDRYRAEDAAAAVVLDLDRRPGRATPQAARDARDRGDEPLYPGHDDLALEKHFGPPVAEETWARAHTVVDVSLRQQLLAPTSLEARAILVEPGPDGSLTIHCSHQFPHGLATGVAGAFGLDAADVRVIVPDAGGAFGSKSPTYPEYLAVVAAARRLGVPVRWVEDRTEALTAASRGRGQDQHVRIAADADGRFLAIDLQVDADVGAHPLGAALPGQTGMAASEAYAVPEVHARSAPGSRRRPRRSPTAARAARKRPTRWSARSTSSLPRSAPTRWRCAAATSSASSPTTRRPAAATTAVTTGPPSTAASSCSSRTGGGRSRHGGARTPRRGPSASGSPATSSAAAASPGSSRSTAR